MSEVCSFKNEEVNSMFPFKKKTVVLTPQVPLQVGIYETVPENTIVVHNARNCSRSSLWNSTWLFSQMRCSKSVRFVMLEFWKMIAERRFPVAFEFEADTPVRFIPRICRWNSEAIQGERYLEKELKDPLAVKLAKEFLSAPHKQSVHRKQSDLICFRQRWRLVLEHQLVNGRWVTAREVLLEPNFEIDEIEGVRHLTEEETDFLRKLSTKVVEKIVNKDLVGKDWWNQERSQCGELTIAKSVSPPGSAVLIVQRGTTLVQLREVSFTLDLHPSFNIPHYFSKVWRIR